MQKNVKSGKINRILKGEYMSIIEIKNLSFKYSSEDVTLQDISLNIEKGEFICILGHNGSGKSTLAKLLVGLLEPQAGVIKINGIEIDDKTIDEVRHDIGIVFQNPDNQFVGVTVKDDIAFGLENRNIDSNTMHELVEKYSKQVSMNQFLERNPEQLSGGEKQRVAIAGVLAMNPEIIIFDEATSMLDPKGVREIINVINSLKKEKTIISITHNLLEATYADRIIVMNKGHIVLDGTQEEVFKETKILKECKLDILDSMKLIEKIENSNINRKDEIIKTLWDLSYQK